MVWFGMPPYCLLFPYVCKREAKRLPYKRDFIQRRCVVRIYQKPSPVGEGGSRRLTDEVSVSLFAPSFGFAQTNDLSLNPVGTGVLDCPLCCPHYLSATRRILINICRAGACSRRNDVHTIFRLRTNERSLSISVGVGAFDDPRKH